MRNDPIQPAPVDEAHPGPKPVVVHLEVARPSPLLILAADEDTRCTDDLCVPAEARS